MKRSLKIQLGLRLFMIGCGLFFGNFAAVALAMFFPFYNPKGFVLGITAEDKDVFEKMLAGVADKNKEAIKTEMLELAKGLMTTSMFEEKMSAMGETDKRVKELSDAVKAQGEKLREIDSKGEKREEEKSLGDLLKDKAQAIKALGNSTGKDIVTIKVQNKALVTRGGLTNSTLGMMLPDVGQQATLAPVIRPLFRSGTISPNSNGIIRYIDQNVITRGAAFVAEGAQKPESAISWIQRSFEIQKIADSIPVTKEAWSDIDFIQSEIRQLLEVNLQLAEDDALYDGSGVAPIITGIYTYAPTFDTAAYAVNAAMPKVVGGNLYDLIAVLRSVIMLNQGSKYDPRTVLMNPMDILRYKLLKATDGHYLLPPFISADGSVIDGVRVVESSQVTANTLVIGDFRYGTVYDDGEGVEVSMGWVNDQFIKNTFTILAEKRLGLLVRNINLPAFRKVTSISAAITAITTP